MKLRFYVWLLLASLSINLNAVPPPEQLLPADTLLVVTVPDWDKAKSAAVESPAAQLWRDPEMKAFKEKFEGQFQTKAIEPLERSLGIKFSDYTELLHGQLTFAFRLDTSDNDAPPVPNWSLVVDTKDKADQLKKNLADLKKKWVDAGKQIKSDKIRDIEFNSFFVSGDDVTKAMRSAFAPADEKDKLPADSSATNKVALMIGQSDSLLLIGNNAKDLEKILVRQSGGQVPALADQSEFQANRGVIRDALAYGWLNFKPVNALLNKLISQAAASAGNPMMPKGDKIFAAMGFDGLKSIAASLNSAPDGMVVQLFLTLPESSRKGLFKMFAMEPKSTAPPPFVPADAVKFYRWRLDSQKAWATVESMVAEISPDFSSMLQMVLSTAGKEKDPNFDVKRSLLGNLGDDWVSYEKSPRAYTIDALNSAPTLLLIGSPNGDQLVQGVKAMLGVAIPATSIKEREFLGRKIFTMPLPTMRGNEDDKGEEHTMSFVASGGYVAVSADAALLEEYLRSADAKPKPLQDVPGLKEAAEKVGGMSTGLLGYENDNQTMRILMEILKQDPGGLEKLFEFSPLGRHQEGGDNKAGFKAWVDTALLPPFEKIARYFYLTVYSGATTPEGVSLKFYTPTPPTLK
jgi:hypothetical protein